eukprot:gene16103-19160_t
MSVTKDLNIVSPMFIVMEYLDKAMHQVFPYRQCAKESDIIPIIYDVLKGLKYLHGKGFVHRDIKPDNILLSQNDPVVLKYIVKICDLGFITKIDPALSQTKKECCGTAGFKPSQYFDIPRHDFYSLGITILSLVNPIQRDRDHTTSIGKHLFDSSDHISDDLRKFISLCINEDEKCLTLTADDLLSHPWFIERLSATVSVQYQDTQPLGGEIKNTIVDDTTLYAYCSANNIWKLPKAQKWVLSADCLPKEFSSMVRYQNRWHQFKKGGNITLGGNKTIVIDEIQSICRSPYQFTYVVKLDIPNTAIIKASFFISPTLLCMVSRDTKDVSSIYMVDLGNVATSPLAKISIECGKDKLPSHYNCCYDGHEYLYFIHGKGLSRVSITGQTTRLMEKDFVVLVKEQLNEFKESVPSIIYETGDKPTIHLVGNLYYGYYSIKSDKPDNKIMSFINDKNFPVLNIAKLTWG